VVLVLDPDVEQLDVPTCRSIYRKTVPADSVAPGDQTALALPATLPEAERHRLAAVKIFCQGPAMVCEIRSSLNRG
jgi:hypothetical protein